MLLPNRSLLFQAVNRAANMLLTPVRTRVFKPEVFAEPILDKRELENLNPQDPIHFKKIRPPLTTETNAMSFNKTIKKFTNLVMRDGRSATARKQIDKTLYKIKLSQLTQMNKKLESDKSKGKTSEEKPAIELNPVTIFEKAVENCKPILKMTPIMKGGITYQVPVPMSDKEREFRSMKLIISACEDKKSNERFYDRLAQELIDAFNNRGKAIKSKIEIHKLAEANRAYAHYRWVQ